MERPLSTSQIIEAAQLPISSNYEDISVFLLTKLTSGVGREELLSLLALFSGLAEYECEKFLRRDRVNDICLSLPGDWNSDSRRLTAQALQIVADSYLELQHQEPERWPTLMAQRILTGVNIELLAADLALPASYPYAS